MLQPNYDSINSQNYNLRDLTLTDFGIFFKVMHDEYGGEKIVVKTRSQFGSDEYIAVNDIVNHINSLRNHYNSNIEIINRELTDIKNRLSEFENLEPANDIVDRIEKLEFLIEEN